MLHPMQALWHTPGAVGWGIIPVFFPYTVDEMILKLYHPDFCSTHEAEYDISVKSCGTCGYGFGIPYIYFLEN